tara:strand:+ start:181 stop:2073 length:1893 start_codon:yes stop_codon:yes gene_type:complete
LVYLLLKFDLSSIFRRNIEVTSSFRTDIQGLRALAVLSVVIYHISPKHLIGGFVGVDIFFVISGYLIIGQICNQLSSNSFSLSTFYVKRFKRLFPAYISVAAITSLFAFFLFLPSEFKGFTSSLVYSSFYISNFYFYSKSGYFDSELQGNPLLHTWSLSVEEQFYALMPFVLIFCYANFNRWKYAGLLAIGVLSFIACLILSSVDINLAFFSPITRFWQFVAGGFAALYLSRISIASGMRELINVSCLIALMGCIIFMSHDDFPGVKVIIPTLATTLFLGFSRSEDLSYRVASIKIARFFGNISYSLYLWHWPVIIFYPLLLQQEATQLHKVNILLLSILFGSFGYYFIEERFRRGTSKPHRVGFATVSLTCLLLLTVWLNESFQESRFTPRQKELESFLAYRTPHFRGETCFLTSQSRGLEDFDKLNCIVNEKEKENILLIGDSHAAHWYSSLNRSISKNQTLSQITASGCKPVLRTNGAKRCKELMSWAYNESITSERFSKVIISARWLRKDIPLLHESIELLQSRGLKIVVIGPVVEYFQPLPRILAMSDDAATISNSSNIQDALKIDSDMQKEITDLNASYFSTLNAMCSDQFSCITEVNNIPVQFDYGHLTEAGAQKILEHFDFL